MQEKQLTITIPAYNAEHFLSGCLDSFIVTDPVSGEKKIDDRLELIVIDDGAKDRTGEIADQYASAYPAQIRVIHKENGGHGSGINAGICNASGRYFKVVDADDTVFTANLKAFLDSLSRTDADVVITGYTSVNEKNGKAQVYLTDCEYTGQTIDMDCFAASFESCPASFQFHGLCYNTAFYRALDLSMTEKVSYEDQEYAILPFVKAQTILFLPLMIYRYRLGGDGQSVSYANLEKHAGNMRTVLEKLIGAHRKAAQEQDWTESRETFFVKRLSIAVTSYYAVMLVKAKDRKHGKKEAESFRYYLKEADPPVAANTEKKYEMLQKAGRFPHLAAFYTQFMDTKLFMRFKKRWLQ